MATDGERAWIAPEFRQNMIDMCIADVFPPEWNFRQCQSSTMNAYCAFFCNLDIRDQCHVNRRLLKYLNRGFKLSIDQPWFTLKNMIAFLRQNEKYFRIASRHEPWEKTIGLKIVESQYQSRIKDLLKTWIIKEMVELIMNFIDDFENKS